MRCCRTGPACGCTRRNPPPSSWGRCSAIPVGQLMPAQAVARGTERFTRSSDASSFPASGTACAKPAGAEQAAAVVRAAHRNAQGRRALHADAPAPAPGSARPASVSATPGISSRSVASFPRTIAPPCSGGSSHTGSASPVRFSSSSFRMSKARASGPDCAWVLPALFRSCCPLKRTAAAVVENGTMPGA
jgi:hypothetical protein